MVAGRRDHRADHRRRLFDIFWNYTNAFDVGSGICVLALGSLLLAKRPEARTVAGMEEVKITKRAA